MKRERETVHQRGRLVYQLEETPPMGRRLLYAMQFVIIFIGSIVLVPMLAADDLGWGPEQVTFLLQCAIFTGGIATFVQAKGLGPVGGPASDPSGDDVCGDHAAGGNHHGVWV